MATHSRTDLFVHFRNSYNHRNTLSKRSSLNGEEENLLAIRTSGGDHMSLRIPSHPLDITWLQWREREQRVKEELLKIDRQSTYKFELSE
jgi:hypothetical protein